MAWRPSRFTGRWVTINRMNMTRHSKPQSGAALAAAKLRLLARLRDKSTDSDAGGASAITPRPSGAAVPLSFAQERLWFLQQWEPASAVYNVARAWRLKGALDVTLLSRCVQRIVQRHEVLRTVLANDGDRPLQQALAVDRAGAANGRFAPYRAQSP